MLVAGDFGAGKSHLLEYFEDLARRESFVVSKVIVSKETPFYNAERVFAAVAENAALPDKLGSAIANVAPGIRPSTPEYAALYRWAANPETELDDRFAATLFLLANSLDDQLRDRIVRFWSGERILVHYVRNALREHDMAEAFTIKGALPKSISEQRLRFMSRVFQTAGYRGWLILIDELELVGRYSGLMRARSYVQLNFWLDPAVRKDGITAVAAITSDYDEAVLGGQGGDLFWAPEQLKARGKVEDAMAAERGMRRIWDESQRLEPPSEIDLQALHERLRGVHSIAYDWAAPHLDLGRSAATTRMREHVRRWINEWDLIRIDAQFIPDTEVRHLSVDYSEDGMLEDDAEGDVVNA